MKRWISLLMLILVGCGSETAPTAIPETTLLEPTVVAIPGRLVKDKLEVVRGPDEIFVTLRTTGGIAGIDRIVTVNREGTVTVTETIGGTTTERKTMATTEQMTALEEALYSDEFQDLDAQYTPERQCCDLMTYELTRPAQVITTMDGATRPPVLDQVLEVLGELTAQAK